MKTRVITMREKIIASAASAALVASMVVCAPSVAFATYDTGSIVATQTSVPVIAGDQEPMAQYFNATATGGDGQWHVDYAVTSGGEHATINKHSGTLTALSEGSAVVTAYLTPIAKPTQDPDNPCEPTLVSATITVQIDSDGADYGYQGANNAILMTSPSVASFNGSNASGWVNTLSSSTAEDGYYFFTLNTLSGFKNYNTEDLFAERNAGNIKLKNSAGDTIATLAAANEEDIVIVEVDVDNKEIVVGVDAGLVTKGDMRLVFESGFVGNNNSNTLGTTVAFIIM